MALFISLSSLVILLCCSAFFSASETAIFSLSSIDIALLIEKKDKSANILQYLLKRPRMVLITIVFGNTLVNICFFSATTVLLLSLEKKYGSSCVVLGSVITLLSVIIFGEVLPKAIAIQKTILLSKFVCRPLYILLHIFLPITYIFDAIIYFFSKLLHADQEKAYITPNEIKKFLELSEKKGVLPSTEHEMLLDLMDLKEIKVREIMIPRVELLKASIHDSIDKIESLFLRYKNTTMEIYGSHEDDILGILYAKEFFLNKTKNIQEIIHAIPFVSENMNVESLLKFMNENQRTEVFIGDEYGGLEGLISLDDLMEVLVDDLEEDEIPLIQPIDEQKYLISGKLPLKEWQNFLNIPHSNSSHCSTVSGLLISLLQRLPKKGDIIQYKNCVMEVSEVKKNRIISFLLTVNYPPTVKIKSNSLE